MMRASDGHELRLLIESMEDEPPLSPERRVAHPVMGSEEVAKKALAFAGDLIERTDAALTELEQNEMLGPAILRSCRDLADVVSEIANDFEQERTERDHQQSSSALIEDESLKNDRLQQQQQQQQIVVVRGFSEEEVLYFVMGSSDFLRDVEIALRSVEESEAEEIADVALTLARLCLISIQNIFATLTPTDLIPTDDDDDVSFSSRIEILDDDDLENESRADFSTRDAIADERKPRAMPFVSDQKSHVVMDRMRVLWPPLGPTVGAAFHWSLDEANKNPLLAMAAGITLWPAVMVTSMVGAPIVVADTIVQHFYDSFSDSPLIEGAERVAAQAFHAGKLSLVTGKLVWRQSCRIASRQIERRGGIEKVAQDIGSMALDRACHPVETAFMAWDGACWGLDMLKGAIDHATRGTEREMANRNMP